jgi:predicted RNase H-like HicB family nuclease
MEIQFTTRIFKEGRTFVAYTREFDVSSCGGARQRAVQNLKEAVCLFLEEAGKMGTLDQILSEAGYLKRKSKLQGRSSSPPGESPCRYRNR